MIFTADIGGTALKYAAFEEHTDAPVFKGELELAGHCGAEGLSAALFEALDGLASRFGKCRAVGVDCAGLIDPASGSVVLANNLGITEPFALCDAVSGKYGVPCVIANDVNAAAVGEMEFGAARDENNFVFVAYGTGVGGAIVLDREIYGGQRGIAGEVGHITTHPDGKECPCGRSGCYERYASTAALVRKAAKADPGVTDGRVLFEKLRAGSAPLAKVLDDWIDEVVLGLVSLTHLFDPSAIILGGGIMNEPEIVSTVGERLRNSVIKEYSGVTVRHAMLGNDAGVYGMYALARKKIN